MTNNRRWALLVAGAMTVAAGWAQAQSYNDTTRKALKIPERCYPVAINPSTEQISTVCRGQPGFSADGLQLFEGEVAERIYFNRRNNRASNLVDDLRSGVGPEPYLTHHWFPILDRASIARPR